MNHVQAELVTLSMFSFHSQGLDGHSRVQNNQSHYQGGDWAWLHRTSVCSSELLACHVQNSVSWANILLLRQRKMKRAPKAVEGLVEWATTLSQYTCTPHQNTHIYHLLEVLTQRTLLFPKKRQGEVSQDRYKGMFETGIQINSPGQPCDAFHGAKNSATAAREPVELIGLQD